MSKDNHSFANSSRNRLLGCSAIEVTSDSNLPKVRELSRHITAMLDNPLTKRFLKRKVHVYICVEGVESIDTNGKYIRIPKLIFDRLTADELAHKIGHEIGHCLRSDGNPRRKLEPETKDAEIFADKIAIYFSGNAQAAKSGNKKINDITLERIANDGKDENSTLIRQDAVWEYIASGSKTHPSGLEREQIIDEISAKMSSDSGRIAVAEELALELEKEHRRLFAHQYARDTKHFPHTR